jgi:hypothetical protein
MKNISELPDVNSVEKLVEEIAADLAHCLTAGATRKRLRVAVTRREMHEIEVFMLNTRGESWRRIRDVTLIVEDDPTNPPYAVIFSAAKP